MNLKEYLLESLQSTYIFEMAYDRKHLKKMVDGLFAQIIENWCLVRYCTLYDPNNTTKNHWKKELRPLHIFFLFQNAVHQGDDTLDNIGNFRLFARRYRVACERGDYLS